MPHATIKGFFRSDAPIPKLVRAFDTAVLGHEPFTVYNGGPVAYGRTSVVLNVNDVPCGSGNAALLALHTSAWKAVSPLVGTDCTFTRAEPAQAGFRAHLTLAMADLDEQFFEEVFAFITDATPIGPDRFTAEYLHLFAFRSQDWTGAWWTTLEWKMLHSWHLGSPKQGA